MLWLFMGVLHLGIMTYQDLFKNKWVDERHNYFMFGATISLIMIYPRPAYFILLLSLISVVLSIIIKKYRLTGEADAQTFAWVFWGFGIINAWLLASFTLFLLGFSLIQRGTLLFARKGKPINQRLPYYPVIFVTFLIVAAFGGLF